MVEAICTFHDHYLGFGEPNCNARLMEFFFRVLFVDLYTVSKIQLYSFATDSLFYSKPCTKHMGEHSTGFALVTLSKHCHGSNIACCWVAVDQSMKYTTFVSPQYFEYMKLRISHPSPEVPSAYSLRVSGYTAMTVSQACKPSFMSAVASEGMLQDFGSTQNYFGQKASDGH